MYADCTIDDLRHLLGADGVTASSNDAVDDPTATDDADAVATCIHRAGVTLRQYVGPRYADASLLSNEWVRWTVAVVAAVYLRRRRADPVPDSLKEQYDEAMAVLKEIAAHKADLPGGTPRASVGMTVTNVEVDQRYPSAPVRAVTGLSVGGPPGFPRFAAYDPVDNR